MFPRPDVRVLGRGTRTRDPGQREGRGTQGQPLRAGPEPDIPGTGHALRNHRAARAAPLSAGHGEGGGCGPERRALDHGASAQPDVLLARRTPRGHRAAAGRTERAAVPEDRRQPPELVRGSGPAGRSSRSRPSATSTPSGARPASTSTTTSRSNTPSTASPTRWPAARSMSVSAQRRSRSSTSTAGSPRSSGSAGKADTRPNPRTCRQPTAPMRNGHRRGSSPGAARPDPTRPPSSNGSSRAGPTPHRATAVASDS